MLAMQLGQGRSNAAGLYGLPELVYARAAQWYQLNHAKNPKQMKPKLTITASKEIEEATFNRMTGDQYCERIGVNSNAGFNRVFEEWEKSHSLDGQQANVAWMTEFVRPVDVIYTGGPLAVNVDAGRTILSAPITMVVPMNWEEHEKQRVIFEREFTE